MKSAALYQSRRRVGAVVTGACLGAVICGASFVASGQDPSTFPPGDIIFTRKTLMSIIARNMYPLDQMVYTGKINLPRGQGHADSIAGMLDVFPLLFPPSTNTWTPGAVKDPAFATFADPAIWRQFDFFSKESKVAAKYAFDASRAENEAQFRKNVMELRLTCDGCHATFQKNN